MALRVTVFGLGEAGSVIAADLVAAGADVHAYDPKSVPTPEGVTRHGQPAPSVAKTDAVLAITAAADAQVAIAQIGNDLAPGTLYADLSTAAPILKQDLAGTAGLRGLLFADVALMAVVPGRGLSTLQLASGNGAGRYGDLLTPLGANVEVIDGEAGDAATRKLLRSVVMKGLAGLLIEGMRAGHAADQADWLWDHLVEIMKDVDQGTMERLVLGSGKHAERRLREMEAARNLLEHLGVEPTMTQATVESFQTLPELGLPDLPGAAKR